jgi:hypothetical protein
MLVQLCSLVIKMEKFHKLYWNLSNQTVNIYREQNILDK